MSTATDAYRWSCARCGVSTGRMDGEPSLLPTEHPPLAVPPDLDASRLA